MRYARIAHVILLTLGATWVVAQERPTVQRTFDGDPLGSPPPGFEFAEARDAAASRWIVQREGEETVLLHAGRSSSDSGLALAILREPTLRELTMSVRLKMRDGERAAGLVWRYQDRDNYYAVQLRLSDQSIGLYRMVRGNRIRMEYEDDLELDPSAWHTLRIRQGEERVRVYIGGIRVFEERDRTFRGPGAAGVWSSSNTTAQFDDLRIEPRSEQRRQPWQARRHE